MVELVVTKANFETEVLQAAEPVLIDFWAPWCGPCRMVSPIVDEIAAEATGFKVGKINVDEQQELAVQYEVMTIPTLAVFQNGKVVKTMIGVHGKEDILGMLQG